MLLRRASDSVLVKGGTWDDGGSEGMEKLATKGGSMGLAAEAVPVGTISCCVDP